MKSGRPGWPAALRSPLAHAILATLAMLGLLLAFHQVVLGAVQQGELRRKATAMQADAAWRCNAMPGARSRRRLPDAVERDAASPRRGDRSEVRVRRPLSDGGVLLCSPANRTVPACAYAGQLQIATCCVAPILFADARKVLRDDRSLPKDYP